MEKISDSLLDEINRQLRDVYGLFEDGNPNWRVVWSTDELEKRFGTWRDFDANNNLVREIEETRLVPKYWHVPDRYILERLMPILTMEAKKELVGREYDYYCVWVFEDGANNPLLPKYSVARYVIEAVHENAAKKVGVKYRNPLHDKKISEEVRREQLKEMQNILFANKSRIGDSLMRKEAVGFTKE